MAKMDEARAVWSEKFDQMDSNGNGYLVMTELKSFLKDIVSEITDEEIADMFSDIDADDSKQITKDEFVEQMSKKDRSDAFTEFFHQYDADGNGILGPDELKTLCAETGFITADDAAKWVDMCDTNDDGKISKAEFLKAMNS